jgi:GT2 family glycosyltransferase
MSTIDLSIIIVNFNTRDLIKSCLDSIATARAGCTLEIIVIDNASTDSSVELLRRFYPDVILITNNDNLGFSKACNQGICISRGRSILLLNSDTELLSDTLKNLDPHWFGKQPHDRIGIVGCKILNADGTLQYSFGHFPSLLSTVLDMFRSAGKRKYLLTGYDRRREVDWVTGAFFLIRRDTIDEIGLLDERFFMYYEEVDWCLRAKQRGWKVLYDPAAAIIHKTPLASRKKSMNDKIAVEVRRSHLYYFWKNRPYAEFIILSIATLFLISLIWMRWTVALFSGRESRTKNREWSRMLLAAAWRTFRELQSH